VPLGKSLGNILDDYFGQQAVSLEGEKNGTANAQTSVEEININRIGLSSYQTRTNFESEKIDSLAENIKDHGLIHPIVVLRKKVTDSTEPSYVLLAGERRLRAVKKLGLDKILAVIKPEQELTERQQAMLSAMENLQREDLNPIELANTYKMLKLTQHIDDQKLADLLGNSLQYVRNYLHLLELPKAVQQALKDRKIGEGQARQLLPLEEDFQLVVLEEILKNDLTVKEIIALIKSKSEKPEKEVIKLINPSHSLPVEIITKADKFASQFPNAKLKCSGNPKKGRIVISWEEKEIKN